MFRVLLFHVQATQMRATLPPLCYKEVFCLVLLNDGNNGILSV